MQSELPSARYVLPTTVMCDGESCQVQALQISERNGMRAEGLCQVC